MAVRVRCPNGHPLTVKDELEGKRVRCPKCKELFRAEEFDDKKAKAPLKKPVRRAADDDDDDDDDDTASEMTPEDRRKKRQRDKREAQPEDRAEDETHGACVSNVGRSVVPRPFESAQKQRIN